MLKREITYEDFNGNTHTESFYFNMSKPELIELEVEHQNGFDGMLQKIIDTKDNKELIAQFKKIILMAYGIKSDDGKRFIKSDELREEFEQTAAFHTLFMELATDDKVAAVFISGILPADMRDNVEKTAANNELKEKVSNMLSTTPPTPPTA